MLADGQGGKGASSVRLSPGGTFFFSFVFAKMHNREGLFVTLAKAAKFNGKMLVQRSWLGLDRVGKLSCGAH